MVVVLHIHLQDEVGVLWFYLQEQIEAMIIWLHCCPSDMIARKRRRMARHVVMFIQLSSANSIAPGYTIVVAVVVALALTTFVIALSVEGIALGKRK